MCLNLRGNEFDHPLTASEDMVVYKHLMDNRKGKFDNFKKSLLTTYRKQPVKLGSTYTSGFSINEDGNVEMGLHSFDELNSAKEDGYYENRYPEEMPIVYVKCLIPKGSRYYEGRFCGDTAYASDQLTYLEIIT